MEEKLSVQWADFKNNISASFGELRTENDFADVTLACEDHDFEVHKLILSASSPFFKALLKRASKQPHHPMIYMRGVQAKDLEALVDFIYLGEANILQENLGSFLAIAEELKLKGLSGLNAEQSFPAIQEPTKIDFNKIIDDRKPIILNNTANFNKDLEIKPKLCQTGSFKIAPKLGQAEDHIKMRFHKAPNNKVKPIIPEEIVLQVETLYKKLETHNGVFGCLKCAYTSTQRGHLKEHVEKHIEGLRYPCNFCGKISSSSMSLRGHLRKHL